MLDDIKQLTKTAGHELFGHAWFDAISNVIDGWMWNHIGDPAKGKHDANNPSGKYANEAGKDVEKNYRDAERQERKERNENKNKK